MAASLHGGAAGCFRAWRRRSRRVWLSRSSQICGGVFGGRPARPEKRVAVVIADDGVLVAFGRGPAAPFGRAIREMPGEEERELGRTAGRDRALERESADGVVRSGSAERWPSSEKSSQKSMGEFHQRPCGQPRQTSV